MIVTRLAGGMGNQMFQYAFGLWLARHSKQPLCFDATALQTDSLRSMELGHFQISANHISNPDQDRIPIRYRDAGRMQKAIESVAGSKRDKLHLRREKPFGFNPDYLNAGSNLYLNGYWQSERFFPGFRKTIRQEFQLAQPLSEPSRRLEEHIDSVQSVAIHVRRGDYVSNVTNQAIYRQLGPSYYQKCLRDLLNHVERPHVFLFSDDIAWCAQHLKFDTHVTPVFGDRSRSAHEDLHLISRCRHAIIANSTFSWWGAFLAAPSHPRRIYYPDPWFADGNHNDASIGCQDWIAESSLTSKQNQEPADVAA